LCRNALGDFCLAHGWARRHITHAFAFDRSHCYDEPCKPGMVERSVGRCMCALPGAREWRAPS